MGLIKLTDYKTKETILVGTEQIIEAKEIINTRHNEPPCTVIRSVGAMITTNYVVESVEEIYKLANN